MNYWFPSKAVGKCNVPFHIVHFVSVVGMWVGVPVMDGSSIIWYGGGGCSASSGAKLCRSVMCAARSSTCFTTVKSCVTTV